VCVTPPDCFPVFTNTWRFYIQTMRPSTLLQPELEWSEPHLTSSMPGTAPQPVDIYISTTTRPLTSPIGSLCSQASCGSGIPFTVHQSNHNWSCCPPTNVTVPMPDLAPHTFNNIHWSNQRSTNLSQGMYTLTNTSSLLVSH
jgi:hypothetical protein